MSTTSKLGADMTDDTIDAVSKALRRAWQLGQTYWQQADSDSYKQQDKSDETRKKFEALVDETRAILARQHAAIGKDAFAEYRRGVKEAFHLANMINANRQGRTAEETCSYLVRSLATLANGGEAPAAIGKQEAVAWPYEITRGHIECLIADHQRDGQKQLASRLNSSGSYLIRVAVSFRWCLEQIDAAPLATEASKPAAQQTLSDGAQFFACYLIDNCENEVVREESVQAWLGKMLASPRYHPAAPSVEQDERAAFEHHLRDLKMPVLPVWKDGRPYQSYTLEKMWDTWCAARAALTSSGRCFFCGEPMDGAHEQDCPQANASANVAQYRNEALSALLVDHSHAASAKDVDAVLKARDAIYSMFANVAQGAEAVTEDISLVRELQKALFYWMPRIAGEDSPAGHKAAEHAYLLIGLDDNSTECYGDQARSSLGIVNRELERIGIACSDAGCPDEMEVADFIADLYARSQAAATVASTDDARECLADVVSHYRALYAGLAFQLNEAAVIEDSDDMTYWKHEIKALERMYAQAERALTAAQSASGDTK